MMHLIAYQQSIDEGNVLSFLTPVPDPSVRVQGNDVVVPQDVASIIGAEAFLGTLGVYGFLLSPSLRRISPYKISPIVGGLVPAATSRRYMHPASPIKLDYNEALNAQSLADPAAAEVHTVLVHLADKSPSQLNGNIVKVRFTVTTLVTAGQWVNAAITFPNLLPTGIYSVVGASLVGAGIIAARWYPVGGKWRPGFPVMQSASGQEDEIFRNGALGEWFQFDEVQPPTLDLLASANAGSATYEGVLDVIKQS